MTFRTCPGYHNILIQSEHFSQNANSALFPTMSVNVSMSMSMGYGHQASQQWPVTSSAANHNQSHVEQSLYPQYRVSHEVEPQEQYAMPPDIRGAEVLYNRPQHYHATSRPYVSHYMLKKARGIYRQTISPEKTSKSGSIEKPNLCRICGKVYARPSTLKTHMRTHSGEKPYRCTDCDKSFSQAANLTAHIRTHSGEKPFHCPICDRQFSQSSSVTTHMRTHSGERPYRCRLCAKAFSDSSTLTKHLRIHSGEKPYQCKLCLLKFSQSGNLKRHMRVHSSG